MSGDAGPAVAVVESASARLAGGVVTAVAGLAPAQPYPRGDGQRPDLPAQHQGMNMADEWTLQSFLELGALPGAVPCARLHCRHRLWEWGLTDLTESGELLVTELLSNAVKASSSLRPGLSVRLWLHSDKRQLLILVWDACPQPPIRLHADENAETGRGLVLVDAISDRWGFYPAEGGKVVWSLITR